MGASLAARVLALAPNVFLLNAKNFLPLALVYRVPLDTEPDTQYLFSALLATGSRFPYGIPVTPDVPA